MKIKIISDGDGCSTKVINAYTKEPLEGVIAVNWSIRGGEDPEAIITVERVPCDVKAEVNKTNETLVS